ncbi:MAG: hypothetical protein JWO31_1175, partial [Phycisphaerales bacterium]|nr:hypothetical protein [Phycisphaerales bacterium]
MSVPLRQPLLLPVADPSQVGEARRAGVALSDRLGFTETARGALALILTEAANNVLRHGRGGELVVRPLDRGPVGGVEVLAIDRGPGIANVRRAMEDGFTTGSTPGTGLGAIRRLSSEFDLFSATAGRPGVVPAAAGGGPG